MRGRHVQGWAAMALIAGGIGLVWWGLRVPAPPAPAVGPPPSARRRPPQTPVRRGPPLGSGAWARQLQADCARQWGVATVPPLWVAPDPVRPHTWFAVAPLAHAGALWWTYATPSHPDPRFWAVPTSLRLSAAQWAVLPPIAQGVLAQGRALEQDQPWSVTTAPPPLPGGGALAPAQAEARGTTGAPVAWQVGWTPAVPGTPGALVWGLTLPWQRPGQSPVWIRETMAWRTTGTLVSGGAVLVVVNGLTHQPMSTATLTPLVPASVVAGIAGPAGS